MRKPWGKKDPESQKDLGCPNSIQCYEASQGRDINVHVDIDEDFYSNLYPTCTCI